jgi:hypothetical protein
MTETKRWKKLIRCSETRTFGVIQMLFPESCTETLLVDNLPNDQPGSPLEV